MNLVLFTGSETLTTKHPGGLAKNSKAIVRRNARKEVQNG